MSTPTTQPRRKFLAAGLGKYQDADPTLKGLFGGPAGVPGHVAREASKAAEAGWDITGHDVNPLDPEGALAAWEEVLRTGPFDIVSIGFGLRKNPDFTALFEKLVNAVIATNPTTKLGFALGPDQLTATIARFYPETKFPN